MPKSGKSSLKNIAAFAAISLRCVLTILGHNALSARSLILVNVNYFVFSKKLEFAWTLNSEVNNN